MLLLKLVLVPLLLVAVTLVVRHLGPRIGGLAAGLPLTSGPISIFVALEQGIPFARRSAVATVAGLVAVCLFCATYAWCASRRSWMACLLMSTAVFVLVSAALLLLVPGLGVALLLVLLAVTIALWLLPGGTPDRRTTAPLAWDLGARAVVATVLVYSLTEGALALGAVATGLLSPFPLFAGVLAAFGHVQGGAVEAQVLMRAVISATPSFAVFFASVALGLEKFGLLFAYLIAVIATIATQRVAIRTWAAS